MYESVGLIDSVRWSALPGEADRASAVERPYGGSTAFWATKRAFDIVVALLGMPLVVALGALLLVANPFWNRGPLMYRQKRMGQHGQAMTVWKFRTMRPHGEGSRGPGDPVEEHRITPLGRWLRRVRIDEMPQLFNVLSGDMSIIGPRPDSMDHALAYLRVVPNYGRRYSVRPGISGLAQVRLGYAEGFALTARKTRLDMVYLKRAGWRLEFLVLRRTLMVVATGFGAR